MKVFSCQTITRLVKLLNFKLLCRKFQMVGSFTLSLSLCFCLCLSLFLSYLLVLFCRNRESSNYIAKYSLRKELIEATIPVSSFTPRKNGYQWGGYSSMDLAVDEQGLWALWGSTANSGKLYASKIDVYKNIIITTWGLNTGRHILWSTTIKFDRYERGLILGCG